MAEDRAGSDPAPSTLKGRRVWTFVIRGGTSFHASGPLTPRLEHDGGPLTLWKVVCTEDQATRLQAMFRDLSGADVTFHTEEQDEEQTRERRALLGLEEVPP